MHKLAKEWEYSMLQYPPRNDQISFGLCRPARYLSRSSLSTTRARGLTIHAYYHRRRVRSTFLGFAAPFWDSFLCDDFPVVKKRLTWDFSWTPNLWRIDNKVPPPRKAKSNPEKAPKLYWYQWGYYLVRLNLIAAVVRSKLPKFKATFALCWYQ